MIVKPQHMRTLLNFLELFVLFFMVFTGIILLPLFLFHLLGLWLGAT